ncbi:MAG: sodium/proton-translocating pyrophosphatase [Candidatus Bathyarchaeia archaeon]|jgi:K(+)-stimulated pyrophosphate-energized sodium pump
MNLYLVFAPLVGLLAIAFAIHLTRDLLRKKEGTAKMIEISDAIKTGAHAYLVRQFLVAGLFVTGITAALDFVLGYSVAFAFSLGSILSGLSAYIGMRVAIYMNRYEHGCEP